MRPHHWLLVIGGGLLTTAASGCALLLEGLSDSSRASTARDSGASILPEIPDAPRDARPEQDVITGQDQEGGDAQARDDAIQPEDRDGGDIPAAPPDGGCAHLPPLEERDFDQDGILDAVDEDDDNDGIDDWDECQESTSRQEREIRNGGFELPDADDGPPADWVSWRPGALHLRKEEPGLEAPEGQQFLELVGLSCPSLFQIFRTTPGSAIVWSLAHRGHEDCDSIFLGLSAANEFFPLPASTWQLRAGSDSWTWHVGTYEVPLNQTQTKITLTSGCTYRYPEVTDPNMGILVDAVRVEPLCQLDRDHDGCPDSLDAHELEVE